MVFQFINFFVFDVENYFVFYFDDEDEGDNFFEVQVFFDDEDCYDEDEDDSDDFDEIILWEIVSFFKSN